MTHWAADLLAATLGQSSGEVERVETHISTVLLHDGLAYKVKKPVRFEFVDQSTRERRQQACARELRLNTRFAPDVYQDVIDIVDAQGVMVDHALRMKRLPTHARLATLLRDEGVDERARSDMVRAVARAIAVAHSHSRRGPHIDATATPHALQALWLRSLRDMENFVPSILDGEVLSNVAARAHQYIEGRELLFKERIRDGMIVDGHGDLLADDIFVLDDGVRILDCLEFDDQLRYGDVLADVAFLAMDFERLGQSALAADLLRWYVEFNAESHPASLQHHYVAYRALVRSKVACIRAQSAGVLPGFGRDGAPTDPLDHNVIEARHLLQVAARHLHKSSVHLVIIGGLPGSGKSTLAANVASARGWPVLRTDVVRKELIGATASGSPAEYGRGAYGRDQTARTYAEMFARTTTALQRGLSVILDASFATDSFRRDASAIARTTKSVFVPLRCDAPNGELAIRIEQRRSDPNEPSDATPEIAAEMLRRADPWPNAFTIDTSRSPEESCQAALDILSLS